MLGREAVVDRQDDQRALPRDVRAEPLGLVEVALDEPAAVEVDHHGSGRVGRRRPVDPHRQPLGHRRRGQPGVLDDDVARRRADHRAAERSVLQAQDGRPRGGHVGGVEVGHRAAEPPAGGAHDTQTEREAHGVTPWR
ncbi:hypothetical protein Acsp06_23080 [Actinomycetospora sp. NBRC 106375]|nr:hypothetical protein Acsp06_23080 [Actinomycetospora sp. NBRC 106375]